MLAAFAAAQSSILLPSSRVYGQRVIQDKAIDFPCLGSTMTNYRLSIDCPVTEPERAHINQQFVEQHRQSVSDMNDLCIARPQSVPQSRLLAVQSKIDLYNKLQIKERQAYYSCNFNSLFSISGTAHDVVLSIERLLDSPDNPLDEINTSFDKKDLKTIVDLLPVKEKYDFAKKVFDFSVDDSDSDLEEDAGSGLKGLAGKLAQDQAAPLEDAGSLIVKLQIASTPGATPNTEDVKTLWMLQKGFPMMIKNIFSGPLK